MRSVLFIHGGGEGAYEKDETLAASLRGALGAACDVRYPRMPDEDSPEYGAWRDRISEELATMDGEVFLVGHSLGGSILLKYLCEEGAAGRPVAGLFLLAAPLWGAEDWEVDEFAIQEDFASRVPELPVFLYHGRDDEVVPLAHLALYAAKLPHATARELDSRGHQFGEDLSEVALDILWLQRRASR